jgi:hypothetical protein
VLVWTTTLRLFKYCSTTKPIKQNFCHQSTEDLYARTKQATWFGQNQLAIIRLITGGKNECFTTVFPV